MDMKYRYGITLLLLCIVVSLMTSCGNTPVQTPTTTEVTESVSPVAIKLDFHGHPIFPQNFFGNIRNNGVDIVPVINSMDASDSVTITAVTTGYPEYLSVEAIDSTIHLRRNKPFGGKAIGFTVTCNSQDFTFYIRDDTCEDKCGIMGEVSEPQPEMSAVDQREEVFLTGNYTAEEIAELVAQQLSFEEACEAICTVGDAIEYLYQRGYRFEPDNHGIAAKIRYDRNAGACVGNSALFNALLDGDYEQMGYVYIFYARTEHVFNYYVVDGEYYFCDFTKIFHDSGRHIDVSPIHLISDNIHEIYEVWPTIEIHNLNSKNGAFRLACIYTVDYYGDPSMPSPRLMDSDDGKHAKIYLTAQELESQQILFLRDEYTFEFIPE